MRKIYPPPFNKFVIFVFYGLLSIAVIASAQNENGGGTLMNAPDCVVDPLSPTLTNGKVIGYFPNTQPYTIDPKKIQWTLYDYINLVVNDLNSIPDNYKPAFDDLINSKNLNRATTKILLSIKNYDLTDWHGDSKFYGTLSKFGDFINNNDLDGMDIEYPGTRGYACKNAGSTWTAKQDPEFVNFVKSMKAKLAGKTIMLTVGVNPYPDYTTHPLLGLNDGTIDFLNIETYHYSLYQNEMNGVPKSNPNSPFTAFSQGHYSWNLNGTGFSNEKIIMSLDFGNTFQIVPSPNISFNQSVSLFNSDFDLPAEIKDQLKLIDDICPYPSQFASVKLYSWPWKNFSTYVLDPSTHYCNAKFGWTRKFDRTTETPWLYKQDNNLPFTYEFVSYEDISSIHFKLSNVQMGGVSISDISYDDDNNTLLNYIHGNPLPDGDLPQNPNSGKGSSPSNPTDSTNADDKNNLDKRPKTRVIVGVVLGVLFGLLILGVSFFFWRRQKKSFLKFKNAGAIPKSSMRSHTTSKNVEVSSEPRFTAPTTVIPVASGYVTAMFDFEGKEENDLSFKKGDKIEVLERGDGPNDWWVGRVNGNVGEFPGNYVKEAG